MTKRSRVFASLLVAVLTGCGASGQSTLDGRVSSEMSVSNGDRKRADTSVGVAFPKNSSIRYLHHSTGEVVWNGGVSICVSSHNSAHGTTYTISEVSYPNDPYPWANYPYDYWNIWVSHAGSSAYEGQATLEMLTQTYKVISFKHCFPVSEMVADSGSPDVASDEKSAENYKLQYNALKQKLHQFPNTRFILWTGAALRQQDTDAAAAQRTRDFFEWAKNTWDEKGDNIFIWDFRALETGGTGLYLAPGNASSDSHPNETFAQTAAPLFCKRLTDVIEGRGDTDSLTGQ